MNILELLATSNYIIVNKELIKVLGLEEAVMFGELCSEYKYYKETEQLEEDWFYSTLEKINENTGLSAYQQRKAINKLVSLGIIETDIKGVPARRYIKINEEQVINLFNNQLLKNLTTRCKKTKQLDVKKINTINNNIINNNINNNKKENIKRKKFEEPTLEDIENYIEEKGMNVDGKMFYDYFTVSGWVDSNGKQVKNWKQKLITWNSHSTKRKSVSDKNKEFFTKLNKEIKEEQNE